MKVIWLVWLATGYVKPVTKLQIWKQILKWSGHRWWLSIIYNICNNLSCNFVPSAFLKSSHQRHPIWRVWNSLRLILWKALSSNLHHLYSHEMTTYIFSPMSRISSLWVIGKDGYIYCRYDGVCGLFLGNIALRIIVLMISVLVSVLNLWSLFWLGFEFWKIWFWPSSSESWFWN